MNVQRSYLRTDRNGTKYDQCTGTCPRCQGRGILGEFVNVNGGECWACGGSGKSHWVEKEYTPEWKARLAERKAKREAAKAEKEAKEAAERKAKYDAIIASAEARKALSNYVGEVGKRQAFTATFERCFVIETRFGFQRIYKFRDENENVYIWKTANAINSYEGTKLTFKATVKEHSEYKNEKQTVLTRVAFN